MTIVIAMRDPDASNDFRTFGQDVEIIDVDYGYMDLRDPDEFREWAQGHQQEAAALRLRGTDEAREAAEYLESLVSAAAVNYDHAEARSITVTYTYFATDEEDAGARGEVVERIATVADVGWDCTYEVLPDFAPPPDRWEPTGDFGREVDPPTAADVMEQEG